MHDIILTHGIHYVRQVAYAQKSHQHREVVVLYEGVITLEPQLLYNDCVEYLVASVSEYELDSFRRKSCKIISRRDFHLCV